MCAARARDGPDNCGAAPAPPSTFRRTPRTRRRCLPRRRRTRSGSPRPSTHGPHSLIQSCPPPPSLSEDPVGFGEGAGPVGHATEQVLLVAWSVARMYRTASSSLTWCHTMKGASDSKNGFEPRLQDQCGRPAVHVLLIESSRRLLLRCRLDRRVTFQPSKPDERQGPPAGRSERGSQHIHPQLSFQRTVCPHSFRFKICGRTPTLNTTSMFRSAAGPAGRGVWRAAVHIGFEHAVY